MKGIIIAESSARLVLGDNIYCGTGLSGMLREARDEAEASGH